MHDLLEEMGKNIVLQESPNDAGRRSRLWSKEEIDLVLTRNKGTEKVQGIVSREWHNTDWHPDCFSNMHNLRILDVEFSKLSGGLNCFPSALKVIGCRFLSLEALPSFEQFCELVSLELPFSKIRQLWNGTPSLVKLTCIDLSYCKDLIETPDFSGTPNLQRLKLKGCINLVEVHESVAQLKKLVNLNLRDCAKLVSLPSYLEMNSLEEFIVSGCSKLEKLPEFGENMRNLSFYRVSRTKIRKLWHGALSLVKLRIINLSYCEDLIETPDFSGTPNLRSLKLEGCINLVKVHESIAQLKQLVNLNLRDCKKLVSLPCYLEMNSLEEFIVFGCSKLEKLPEFGENMKSLSILDVSKTNIMEVPSSIIHFTNLKHFVLSGCPRLQSIPELPPNLIRVYASCCPSLRPLLALRYHFTSLVSQHPNFSQGPYHLLYKDLVLQFPGDIIPAWFEQRDYYFSAYGRSVHIKADIPYDIAEIREWLGISVCLVFKNMMPKPSWKGCSIEWEFLDDCCPNESHESKIENSYFDPYLYIAFFPYYEKNYRPHPSSEDRQVELRIYCLDNNDGMRPRDECSELSIVDCGWHLIHKKDFDLWSSTSNFQNIESDNDKRSRHEFEGEGPSCSSIDSQTQPPPTQHRKLH